MRFLFHPLFWLLAAQAAQTGLAASIAENPRPAVSHIDATAIWWASLPVLATDWEPATAGAFHAEALGAPALFLARTDDLSRAAVPWRDSGAHPARAP